MSESGVGPPSLSDLASKCIRCGFCLESCPTYVLTGEETESPRGRIYLARSADEGRIPWEAVRPHLDRCLGCRACETACPSGVEYGALLELAREHLPSPAWSVRLFLLKGLSRPAEFRRNLKLSRLWPGRKLPGFLSRLLSGQSPEAEQPIAEPVRNWPQLDESELPPIQGEVLLLEGCAMRVLYPNVHEATRRLVRRIGFRVRPVPGAGCCGALHAHNGFLQEAGRLRNELQAALTGELPIMVNAAGCGSWMRESGFGDRAIDASVFLWRNGLAEVLAKRTVAPLRVAYHDACHLAHGQGVRAEPRALLGAIPGLQLIELEESDRCCGSAGIYNLIQPKLARRLLDRKWSFIEAAKVDLVAMGNPGCHAWIGQAAREHGRRVRVVHTLELLEEALSGCLDGSHS